ncbi:GntR family transcriptional regulator [Corynebacterium callunae]|uniref:GntR family transcriptional regulator n=1 Tax=Corynebacterium callunae TaxID=1721 RepID=UPI0039820BEB
MTTAMATSQELAALITSKIDRGELTSGTRLSEVSLAEDLGVSRNTLREAFRVLSQDGLVDHIPNRGVFVHRFSKSDVNDIYAYRLFVELAAIRSAQDHPEQVERSLVQMRHAYQNAVAANEQGDWQTVGSENSAFHLAIVELAEVKRLVVEARKVLALARIGFLETRESETFHSPYVNLNGEILQRLERRDFKAAEDFLQEYLERSRQDLLSRLPEK